MKDAVSYWYCNSCGREFMIEEEPGYANLAEVDAGTPSEVERCPFCGSDNIEVQE